MGTKKLILILSSILSCSCAVKQISQPTLEETTFKKFTLSICLGTAFEEKEIKKDANKSANAYQMRGNMPPEAIDESRNLVDKWLHKSYLSKSGKQIQIMKCIDLYESNDLLNIYKKYSPCNNKKNWYDPEDYVRQCVN